jgi:hypothetical protein
MNEKRASMVGFVKNVRNDVLVKQKRLQSVACAEKGEKGIFDVTPKNGSDSKAQIRKRNPRKRRATVAPDDILVESEDGNKCKEFTKNFG